MATPVLAQSAFNSVCKGQSKTVNVSFSAPTKEKSLLVMMAVAAGGDTQTTMTPSDPGFVQIRARTIGNLWMTVWYYEGAAAITSVGVTVSCPYDRSLQVRVLEYTGAAQSNALDQVSVLMDADDGPDTGTTGIVAIADEIVVAFMANRYASTAQSGFNGGLTRLYEHVTPQYYGQYSENSNADEDRSRCTVHHCQSNSLRSWYHRGSLSSWRDWIAIIVTFRGGISGPKKMTSKLGPPVSRSVTTAGGRARLDAFGPMKSRNAPAIVRSADGTSSSAQARIGPFNYQYRLGGWSGLLIGSGTVFNVEGTDGLNGWQVRSSDDDIPRDDGALRGIDLESARQVLFKVNVGSGRNEVERNMDILARALVPRRDTDWELLWRHPTQPLKMMRVRPIDMTRKRSADQLFMANQQFALKAVDPRHYSAVVHKVTVPVTPAGALTPTTVNVTNLGNAPAYPLITIKGPTSGPPVTRIEMVNSSALVTFDVSITLLNNRSTLVGDMEARITGAPRSTISLDGQSKYGSWQLPRDAFHIDPDPTGLSGYNVIYLRTTPAGAPVTATLQYRDTWAG